MIPTRRKEKRRLRLRLVSVFFRERRNSRENASNLLHLLRRVKRTRSGGGGRRVFLSYYHHHYLRIALHFHPLLVEPTKSPLLFPYFVTFVQSSNESSNLQTRFAFATVTYPLLFLRPLPPPLRPFLPLLPQTPRRFSSLVVAFQTAIIPLLPRLTSLP